MGDLTGYGILVVDDEVDTVEFFRTVLEDSGATVFVATDGESALQLARKEHPHLITLDLSMPGMDGTEVFREIREDPSLEAIPVCIITGKPEMRRLVYQRRLRPPEGYLDKPVDEKRLLYNIRKILSVSRKHTPVNG